MLAKKISKIDLLYFKLVGRGKFFAQGLGDIGFLEALPSYIGKEVGPSPLKIRWSREKSFGKFKSKFGFFKSPMSDILPVESEYARVMMVSPPVGNEQTKTCIIFAGTGDERFKYRLANMAMPLVKHNIRSIILENSFYGKRRPHGQREAYLNYASDLWKMCMGTIAEGVSLAHHFSNGGEKEIGLTGVSMGGQMAAFVASQVKFPVALSAVLCPIGCSAVFTHGLLSGLVDRKSMAKERALGKAGDELFNELVDATTFKSYSTPQNLHSAIILGAKNDAYLPPQHITDLHNLWNGSQLVWLDGGHVSSTIINHKKVVDSVLNSFTSLNHSIPKKQAA